MPWFQVTNFTILPRKLISATEFSLKTMCVLVYAKCVVCCIYITVGVLLLHKSEVNLRMGVITKISYNYCDIIGYFSTYGFNKALSLSCLMKNAKWYGFFEWLHILVTIIILYIVIYFRQQCLLGCLYWLEWNNDWTGLEWNGMIRNSEIMGYALFL